MGDWLDFGSEPARIGDRDLWNDPLPGRPALTVPSPLRPPGGSQGAAISIARPCDVLDSECVAFLQWALPRLGLRWAGFRRVRGQVCKRIRRRLAELGDADLAAYRRRLQARPAEWSHLDALCRVTISRFLRDRAVHEQLAAAVLPALAAAATARGAAGLAVWSAGCACGEEPYGLALLQALGGRPSLPLRIVATDVDREVLRRARRACYPPSSLRELPAPWREAAFEACDGELRLRERFRSAVLFRRQDLRRRMPAGPFDLVLCRNLAFTYFDEALQRDVLARLRRRIVAGGALVIGRHERLPEPSGFLPWPGAGGVLRRVEAPPPRRRAQRRIGPGSTNS